MSASNARMTRRRGVYGVTTSRVLTALRRPGRLADVRAEVGLREEEAHAHIKHLHERGLLIRVARGVYQISAAGEQALSPRTAPGVRFLSKAFRTPPAGPDWTPERTRWLELNYERLGHRRCAELLGKEAATVHARAVKLGLSFGQVPGHILITELSDMLERDYGALYGCAERAGVLTFPGSVAQQERRPKAMVPEWWADELASEAQPPTPDDVALASLCAELGLSRSHASRLASADAYLRTPVSGGQARLYVSDDTAGRIRERCRLKAQIPSAPVVGQAGVLSVIEAAGPEGLSGRELYEFLACSRAATRLYTRLLSEAGAVERCRAGSTLDPYVYRAIRHQGQPPPQQRRVVIPGRPKKALAQAAD